MSAEGIRYLPPVGATGERQMNADAERLTAQMGAGWHWKTRAVADEIRAVCAWGVDHPVEIVAEVTRRLWRPDRPADEIVTAADVALVLVLMIPCGELPFGLWWADA